MIVASAAALVIAGAVFVYAASPNQRMTRKRLPPRASGWGGAFAIALGLLLLLQWAGPATAIFIASTLLMLVWSIVPVAAAWARRPRESRR